MRKGIAGSSVTLRFDLRPVLFVIGILMLVVGVAMLVPGMVGLALATANGPAFMMAAGITIGLRLGRGRQSRARSPDDAASDLCPDGAGLGRGTRGRGLAVRFLRAPAQLYRCLLQAMSGLTTTGSTVLTGLDAMPRSILLWRGLLHWLGGVGIVVMAMAMLPLPQGTAERATNGLVTAS
jgi:trk system potassium uptake protein